VLDRQRLRRLTDQELRERRLLPPGQRKRQPPRAKRGEIPTQLLHRWMQHCMELWGPEGVQTAATIALAWQGGLRASDVEDVSKWGPAFEKRGDRPYVTLVRRKTATSHEDQGFYLDAITGIDSWRWLDLAALARGHTLGRADQPLLVNPATGKPWLAREWRNVVTRLLAEVPPLAEQGTTLRGSISSHSFRVTAANSAKRQGVPIEAINQQLGWTKKSKTFSFSYERTSEEGGPEAPVG